MGFFKEFKDDLTQAVNELLPEDESTQEDTKEDQLVDSLDAEEVIMDGATEEEEMKDWLQEFVKEATEQTDNITEVMSEEEYLEKTEEEEEKEMANNSDEMDDNVDMDLLDFMNEDEEQVVQVKEETEIPFKLRSSVGNDDSVTVITKGTTITGSITSDGSLDVMGTITGDIECLGKLSITGKVIGNSMAAEVYVNTERLVGSINSEGSVKIGLGTVLIGDIVGTSGVIAGAVKGEIDINGPVVIDSTAIIKGNIKAKSVQINNGAVLEGFCSLSYSSVDLENIFE